MNADQSFSPYKKPNQIRKFAVQRRRRRAGLLTRVGNLTRLPTRFTALYLDFSVVASLVHFAGVFAKCPPDLISLTIVAKRVSAGKFISYCAALLSNYVAFIRLRGDTHMTSALGGGEGGPPKADKSR